VEVEDGEVEVEEVGVEEDGGGEVVDGEVEDIRITAGLITIIIGQQCITVMREPVEIVLRTVGMYTRIVRLYLGHLIHVKRILVIV
jgi:hypothetical protein